MSDLDEIIKVETGLDLRNSKLVEEVLGPEIGARIGEVLGDIEKGIEIVTKVYSTMMKGVVFTSVPALIFAAVEAIKGLVAWIKAKLKEAEQENINRKIEARDDFVEKNYRVGAWSQVIAVSGPTPKDLDRVLHAVSEKGKQKHLDQYSPKFVVWHMKRVTKPAALRPTWPWNPRPNDPDVASVDSPPQIAKGYPKLKSIIGGLLAVWDDFGSDCIDQPRPVRAKLVNGAPTVQEGRYCFSATRPAIPGTTEKLAEKYWCDPPSGGAGEASKPGCGIPPGYRYLFSWGTYPYVGWNGEQLRLGPYGVSLCIALTGLTPVHAMVDSKEVEICYRYWLEQTKLRTLPYITPGQHDPGYLALDEDGLPWGPNLDAKWPYGYAPSTNNLTIRDVRNIEQSYRDFFRVRHAAIYQFDKTADSFKKAAAESVDPIIRSLAGGNAPPPRKAYRRWDPVNDGFNPKDNGASEPDSKEPNKPPAHTNTGEIKTPDESGGGGGLVIALAGLALVGGAAVVMSDRKRKRRRR